MPRPPCPRRIQSLPGARAFAPLGAAVAEQVVVLGLDQLEALRLADLEGLHQAEAAVRMGVSRPTFGRIVAAARRAVAEALVAGRPLAIEGGAVTLAQAAPEPRCPRCARELTNDTECGPGCPRCRRRQGRVGAHPPGGHA